MDKNSHQTFKFFLLLQTDYTHFKPDQNLNFILFDICIPAYYNNAKIKYNIMSNDVGMTKYLHAVV